MTKLSWKPWHEVVEVREDLRSGELALNQFAADLYDVAMGRAKPIYQQPGEFFALTYPTYNLRRLAREVVFRLAGRSDKAVRQLVLTYGGGKTHSLITLYHLVTDPAHLPDLPAVREFQAEIGFTPPKARVAVISFDRLDPDRGLEVRGPDGSTRAFLYPWSVLAYQLGGDEGLRILGMKGEDERKTPPFTNVMEELLTHSGRDGMVTLILMDEVLMWARTMAGLDRVWRDRLQDFFQNLTQAVTKVEGSAVIASLLATDPRKSDPLGREIVQELSAVFRREQEEPVEPVAKEDVAEVLCRRLFTPPSLRNREALRPHVVAALKGIAALDEQTQKEGPAAEERYLKSYPFHPELTDVFYSKWTNLEGFQRTRGVLRTFALALREAAQWDDAPLIGANVFLNKPGEGGLSEAARELTSVASSEEYEGRRQEWSAILQGELEKAGIIERDLRSVQHREVEQSVMATFLHSQPIGQRASTRELLALVGHTAPDRIELEQALLRWTGVSWFLDDEALSEAQAGPNGVRQLPKTWRLGSKPNLIQMHHVARERVMGLVEDRLLLEISRLKGLTAGASGAGARVHNLPSRPGDVEDDGEFHFAVLGPSAASDAGRMSSVAERFLQETTAADRPRVYRNALVLAVPSREGLDAARAQVRDALGWEEVTSMLRGQELDPTRQGALIKLQDEATHKVPGIIRQAYCVVVTVSDRNVIQAFRVTIEEVKNLFESIKDDARARIQDTQVNAAALLPEGPYDLWREGETSQRVKDLAGAFAQYPHLPKMLKRQAIYDTLGQGCRDGLFVLRLTRPDHSTKTFWRCLPDDVALKDPGMELILPQAAELDEIVPELLAASVLPSLWSGSAIRVRDVLAYFNTYVARIAHEGFEESLPIPRASQEVVYATVRAAIQKGLIWLLSGPTTLCGEDVPDGVLTPEAELLAPPTAITAMEILSYSLPDAWQGAESTALAVYEALSQKAERPLPWPVVRQAIDGALRTRYVALAHDSVPWPCDYPSAQGIKLRVPEERPQPDKVIAEVYASGVRVAEAELTSGEIQTLAERIGDILKEAVGKRIRFRLRVEITGIGSAEGGIVERINAILQKISEKLRL